MPRDLAKEAATDDRLEKILYGYSPYAVEDTNVVRRRIDHFTQDADLFDLKQEGRHESDRLRTANRYARLAANNALTPASFGIENQRTVIKQGGHFSLMSVLDGLKDKLQSTSVKKLLADDKRYKPAHRGPHHR